MLDKNIQTTMEAAYTQINNDVNLKQDKSGIVTVKSKNLFNKEVYVSGYINNNGTISPSSSYITSELISVTQLLNYFGKGLNHGIRRALFFTDANTYTTTGFIDSSGGVVNNLLIPTGCTFVRISIFTTDLDSFQLELGTTGTSYEDYYNYVSTINGIKINRPLQGLGLDTNNSISQKIITTQLASKIGDSDFTVVKSKNLFDKSSVTSGIINSLGDIGASGTYTTSSLINILPSTAYYGAGVLGFRRALFYLDGVPVSATYIDATTKGFTTPSGVNGVRISIFATDLAVFQLELGTTPTYYAEFTPYITKIKNLPINNSYTKEESNALTSPFYSRSILPKVLYGIVGLEWNLYYDGFNLMPEYGKGEPNYMMDIRSEVESTWKGMNYRSYRRNFIASDIGTHTLTIDTYRNKSQILSTSTPDESFTSTLKVVANTCPTTQKRILSIGDSTEDAGTVSNAIYLNMSGMTGIKPIMLGTRFDNTRTWKHEARTEKTFSHYAVGDIAFRFYFTGLPTTFTQSDVILNPIVTYKRQGDVNSPSYKMIHQWKINGDGTGFCTSYGSNDVNGIGTIDTGWTGVLVKESGDVSMPVNLTITNVEVINNYSIFFNNEGKGVLDFNYYRTSILGLTTEKIDLFTIDLGINDIYTGNKTESDITNIINNIKLLIAAYLADGNGKIMICYPKSRSSVIASSDRRHYPMRIDMQRLRERILQEFDFNASYPTTFICASGAMIDRWYGYPLVSTNIASRIQITETKPSQGVHPDVSGYNQIGDAMTACIIYLLNN